jgi:ribosomal protein S18 acetylase RimI-like enzyme
MKKHSLVTYFIILLVLCTATIKGYISDLAVDKDFEGRGIGRMLLETAEDWARTKGYRLLTLYVFATNARAQHVFEKSGFSRDLIKYAKELR